jgi:hypothetical protein
MTRAHARACTAFAEQAGKLLTFEYTDEPRPNCSSDAQGSKRMALGYGYHRGLGLKAGKVLPRRLAGFELPRVEYAIFDQPASALHSANARSPTLRYPVAAIPNAR